MKVVHAITAALLLTTAITLQRACQADEDFNFDDVKLPDNVQLFRHDAEIEDTDYERPDAEEDTSDADNLSKMQTRSHGYHGNIPSANRDATGLSEVFGDEVSVKRTPKKWRVSGKTHKYTKVNDSSEMEVRGSGDPIPPILDIGHIGLNKNPRNRRAGSSYDIMDFPSAFVPGWGNYIDDY